MSYDDGLLGVECALPAAPAGGRRAARLWRRLLRLMARLAGRG